jgi:methylated-DNA-[protein]-cysteine S-methyltransferase
MTLAIGRFDSPIGVLALATVDDCVVGIDLRGDASALEAQLIKNSHGSHLPRRSPEGESLPRRSPEGGGGPSAEVLERLRRYFDGDIAALDEIAVDPVGTPFQRRVWTALRDVRAGTTTSYSELARRIGTPNAVRAVGAANGANPIPIVIPCHRVIGADGRLVGYGGGLDRKRWLLAHEGVGTLALL